MKFNHVTWLSSVVLISSLISCQKGENSLQYDESSVSANLLAVAGISSNGSITSARTATAPDDSVYVVYHCSRGIHLDTVAEASLPAAVSSCLDANYSGYTFQKAYTLENSSNSVTGYIAVVMYNEKPVAIEFDAAGNFTRVLEQREGKDRQGKGWHHGGRFDGRDGKNRDTVALSAIPASVLQYFSSNYPADTLVAAFRSRDSSLVLLSRQNGAFATVFSAAGDFVSRVPLQTKAGQRKRAMLPGELVIVLLVEKP